MRIYSIRFTCFLSLLIASYSMYAQSILPAICPEFDKIFINATFITMNPKQPEVTAVAVNHDRIAAFDEQALFCQNKNTQVINLNGLTVTPGFIDTYSQFVFYGWLANHSLDLSTTNVFQRKAWKPIKTITQFLAAIEEKSSTDDPWLVISGYDEGRIKGDRLNQTMLEELGIKKPIIIFYASGQKALLNHAATQLIQPDKNNIKISEDGIIRGPSFKHFLATLITPISATKAILTAADHYSRQGYTTITESLDLNNWLVNYDKITSNSAFPLDVIYSRANLIDQTDRAEIFNRNPRVYPGPIVITVDGFAQDYSAYLTSPYYKPPVTFGKNWQGALSRPAKEIEQTMNTFINSNAQLAIEAHGDAAIDFSLNALQKSVKTSWRSENSPIFINIEYIRDDQLQRLKTMGIKSNWFSPYLFYWGESMCRTRLGPERAFELNPLHSAKKVLGPVSTHASSTAIPPSPIGAMDWMTTRIVQHWNSPINRQCPQYFNINERISPQEALASFTINAAALYHLDKEKGSLEIGKLANMTLLSANPLTVRGNNYTVEGTIVRGNLHLISPKNE